MSEDNGRLVDREATDCTHTTVVLRHEMGANGFVHEYWECEGRCGMIFAPFIDVGYVEVDAPESCAYGLAEIPKVVELLRRGADRMRQFALPESLAARDRRLADTLEAQSRYMVHLERESESRRRDFMGVNHDYMELIDRYTKLENRLVAAANGVPVPSGGAHQVSPEPLITRDAIKGGHRRRDA